MGFCGFFCKRLVPLTILAIALFVAYLFTTPVPLGTFFSIIFKVVGFFYPEHVTVPTDLTPKPRWENEMFFELPSGAQMPGIGLGLCCRPAAYDDESVRRMVLHFLLEGGRTLDTAHLYTNHKGVGQGIRDAIAAGITREEIFVTTKIFPGQFGAQTEQWIPKILEELGLEYVDLVLLHMPYMLGVGDLEWKNRACGNGTKCRQVTWEKLSAAVNKGLIRDIGVSNFAINEIEELEGVGAPVAVNQISFNPWSSDEQKALVKYCINHKITPTGYFSLGGMIGKGEMLSKNTIQKIAEKYGKSTSQVLLRWSLQTGVSVIPGTKSPKHMRENLDVYNFVLSDEDMKTIDRISKE